MDKMQYKRAWLTLYSDFTIKIPLYYLLACSWPVRQMFSQLELDVPAALSLRHCTSLPKHWSGVRPSSNNNNNENDTPMPGSTPRSSYVVHAFISLPVSSPWISWVVGLQNKTSLAKVQSAGDIRFFFSFLFRGMSRCRYKRCADTSHWPSLPDLLRFPQGTSRELERTTLRQGNDCVPCEATMTQGSSWLQTDERHCRTFLTI